MESDTDTNIEFMDEIYSTTTSFRHSFTVERALQKAADEKRVSKTHVIQCCLLGQYNLNRYIDGFDIEDLNWIHERQIEAFHQRQRRRAAMDAVREHERVDAEFTGKVEKKRK